MTAVEIDRDDLAVTAEFAAAHVDVPVTLAEVRLVVDSALSLWGEAVVEFCVDGIWHRPERMRIALEDPAADRETYADGHEVWS